jgi:hypothetical protein
MFQFEFCCPVWYYAPKQSFPKSKMLRGWFIGIAKNVGDAFCFHVLTDANDTKKPQQVIARMVVKRCYPQKNPPVVEKTCSKKLNFYKSDGITPLEEPFANDKTLPITNIIAEERLENAPETIEDPNDSSVDLLGDAIAEVYGPSCKHQRIEDMIAEETVEQAEVVSGSSKTVETEQPTVQHQWGRKHCLHQNHVVGAPIFCVISPSIYRLTNKIL